jgi:hypothetical protein
LCVCNEDRVREIYHSGDKFTSILIVEMMKKKHNPRRKKRNIHSIIEPNQQIVIYLSPFSFMTKAGNNETIQNIIISINTPHDTIENKLHEVIFVHTKYRVVDVMMEDAREIIPYPYHRQLLCIKKSQNISRKKHTKENKMT